MAEQIKTMKDGSLPWSLAEWEEEQERSTHMPEHNAADLLGERLRAIGVQVKVEGDPNPTVYILSYANIAASGTTLELATVLFVRELLRLVPVEKLI